MNLKNTAVFASFAVNDVKKARAFYETTLGLSVNAVPGMDGILEIVAANYSRVMVYDKGDAHLPADFTVLNIPVENIETAMKDLKGKGVTFEVYDEGDVKTDDNGLMRDSDHHMAIAWFKDPAGNIVSIIENAKSR